MESGLLPSPCNKCICVKGKRYKDVIKNDLKFMQSYKHVVQKKGTKTNDNQREQTQRIKDEHYRPNQQSERGKVSVLDVGRVSSSCFQGNG